MSDDSNGPVRISNREIYDTVLEVRDEVRDMKSEVRLAAKERENLKTRTRALELKFYGILAGLITSFGALGFFATQGGA